MSLEPRVGTVCVPERILPSFISTVLFRALTSSHTPHFAASFIPGLYKQWCYNNANSITRSPRLRRHQDHFFRDPRLVSVPTLCQNGLILMDRGFAEYIGPILHSPTPVEVRQRSRYKSGCFQVLPHDLTSPQLIHRMPGNHVRS